MNYFWLSGIISFEIRAGRAEGLLRHATATKLSGYALYVADLHP